jgi:hypothetical protein
MEDIGTTVLTDLELLETNEDTLSGLAGRSIEDCNE